MKKPSHLDDKGRVTMVDVSQKTSTERLAVAGATVHCERTTVDAIFGDAIQKGEALAAARIAGIQAAKQTGTLIPLCHPIGLTHVEVNFTRHETTIDITASARCVGQTGVEMEAMTAAAIAGLTLYDMAKSIDRSMVLSEVRLLEKRGGKSGHWLR